MTVKTKGVTEIGLIFFGKFAALVQSDFIEQAAKETEAAYALAGTAEGRIEH